MTTAQNRESRERVFYGLQRWEGLISIPDWDSIYAFGRSPNEFLSCSSAGNGWATKIISGMLHIVNDSEETMEVRSSALGRFRVLDCYCKQIISTFTTHAGQMESLESGRTQQFVSNREFVVDRCYELIRTEPTTILDFGRTILIHEAQQVGAGKTNE